MNPMRCASCGWTEGHAAGCPVDPASQGRHPGLLRWRKVEETVQISAVSPLRPAPDAQEILEAARRCIAELMAELQAQREQTDAARHSVAALIEHELEFNEVVTTMLGGRVRPAPPRASATTALGYGSFDAGGGPTPERGRNSHKTSVVFGRDPGCDFVLPYSAVSTRHATVMLTPSGSLMVGDLASTNGTFVGGRQLAPGETATVAPGERVYLGPYAVVLGVRDGGVTARPDEGDPGGDFEALFNALSEHRRRMEERRRSGG